MIITTAGGGGTIAASSGDLKSLFWVSYSGPFLGRFLKVDFIENEICVEGLGAVSGLAISWTLIEQHRRLLNLGLRLHALF